MGYGKKIYDMATDRIAQRKLKAEKDADRRRAEIYKAFPAFNFLWEIGRAHV